MVKIKQKRDKQGKFLPASKIKEIKKLAKASLSQDEYIKISESLNRIEQKQNLMADVSDLAKMQAQIKRNFKALGIITVSGIGIVIATAANGLALTSPAPLNIING